MTDEITAVIFPTELFIYFNSSHFHKDALTNQSENFLGPNLLKLIKNITINFKN